MSHTLQAKTRAVRGRKTNALRAEGRVPAVVYGADTDSQSITIDRNDFLKSYKDAGESSLIELKIDDKEPLNVLIQDYQQDAVSDEVIHVDFRSVDMKEVIDAVVELVFIGESPAVKNLGGTLIRSRDTVTIECLPGDLIRNFEVNLSKLETFDDAVHVSDLKVPQGVTILEDKDLTIAVVAKPRTEAEIAALDETAEEDVEGVDVEDGEEGEQGDADEEKGKPAEETKS